MVLPISSRSSHPASPVAQLDLFDLLQIPKPSPSTAASLGVREVLPAVRLASAIAERIDRGEAQSSEELFALASDFFGGTLAEGAFSAREAYDAAELGLHLALLRRDLAGVVMDGGVEEALEGVAETERLVGLLPSQTRRSQEQQAFQQFSTPASYAFACAWAAALQPGDVVLEPSAGTGALLAWPLGLGLQCFANELAERRADLLRILLEEGGQDPEGTLFRENAEHLHAVFPVHVRPSVVLMNPPFSQTAGRLGDRRVPQVGVEHVQQGLKRLKLGGRLVAVVSAAARRSSRAQAPFFDWLEVEPFALRADVEVSGSVYRAYGTSVETRVLVIDAVEDDSETCVTGRAESVQELIEWLAPIRALCTSVEASEQPGPVGKRLAVPLGECRQRHRLPRALWAERRAAVATGGG